jgi:hypothetical protein
LVRSRFSREARLIGVQSFDKSHSAELAAADVEIAPDCEVPVEVDD